jgi:hypothetical protein
LERLARLLLGQLVRRQLPQLIVDQRQKLLGGVRVALLDGGQDASDFGHWRCAGGEERWIAGLCPPTRPAATRQSLLIVASYESSGGRAGSGAARSGTR